MARRAIEIQLAADEHKALEDIVKKSISEQWTGLRAQITLLAALALHEETVVGQCFDRHRHEEFLIFLKHPGRCYPRVELHLIIDNLSMHKYKDIKKWLNRNKRIQVHFIPTYASWLSQIELWFSILSRKIVNRGVFSSKEELVSKIMEFIKGYNKEAKPS